MGPSTDSISLRIFFSICWSWRISSVKNSCLTSTLNLELVEASRFAVYDEQVVGLGLFEFEQHVFYLRGEDVDAG